MGTLDLFTPCMLQQDAMSVNQLVQQLKQQDALVSEGATRGKSLWKPIDRVVFIDSTWNQTHSILRVSYGFLTVCGVCTCTYYACGRGTMQFVLPVLVPRPTHHPVLDRLVCSQNSSFANSQAFSPSSSDQCIL